MNHIEGSTLTHDQTVQIFDRATFSGTAEVDVIVEARNHFRAFDHVLDTWDEPFELGLSVCNASHSEERHRGCRESCHGGGGVQEVLQRYRGSRL